MSLLPFSALAVDEPPHQVILQDGKYELREYPPILVAEVTVTGDMRLAGSRGFRLLADFIFGNNEPAEKIEMTAPVMRTELTDLKNLPPINRIKNKDRSWTVTFVMPEKWQKENLPQPNNPDVSIREMPAELIASIKFSGRGTETAHNKKQILLEKWIDEQGYDIVGKPRHAGYDAPWIPWFLRRNEVMIPVVKRDISL